MVMNSCLCNTLFVSDRLCALSYERKEIQCCRVWVNSSFLKPRSKTYLKLRFQPSQVVSNTEGMEEEETKAADKPRFGWVQISPDINEAQKQDISQISPQLAKRCRAVIKQVICFSPEKTSLRLLLAAWVKSMKPRRVDWLAVLKELSRLNHPRFLEVAELALLEESFEASVRDYTKIIHGYAKQNRLHDAENILLDMNRRGFICDKVILTALIHMYSKAGNLKLAEDTFEEMKLLGPALDRRAYGSIIMAYIRAGMPKQGEDIVREMEAKDIYAGREVYKALLRAYSMVGDSIGAQRIFDAIQLAGIIPDAKLSGLLMNAYILAGQYPEARITFENLRKAGLEPNDKCVALVLDVYEKENRLNHALELLIDLERDGFMLGKEASKKLVDWFRRLGVVEEVELVLREFNLKEA